MSKKSRIVESVDVRIKKDLIFLNNPVLIEGLALTPVVAAAVTLKNAVVLSIAMAVIAIPVRFIGNLFVGIIPQRLRIMFYSLMAGILYIPAVLLILQVFSLEIAGVGLYLPIIVVDSLVLIRSEIPVRESMSESLLNGIKVSIGFSGVIILVGLIREVLSQGKIWGAAIPFNPNITLFETVAGGFILLALLCAATQSISSAIKRRIYSGVKKDDE